MAASAEAAICHLQQYDVFSGALLAHFLRPQADLDLADVGFAQQEHTQTALTDAAAHAQGQSAVQDALVEGEGQAVFAVQLRALAAHGGLVHADAHAGQLHGLLEGLVPEHQVAVQGPVVVVRGAAVVGLAAFQFAADADDDGGGMLFDEGVLSLLAGESGVEVLQLLGGDEGHVPVQIQLDLGVHAFDGREGGADGVDDVRDGPLQLVNGPHIGGDDLLPIPLVHIDGVQGVRLLVPADGVHVGPQARVGLEAVFAQGLALPLGQGMDHLGALDTGNAGNIKGNGALDAAQIVVQARGRVHEQGSGGAHQVQTAAQLELEGLLDEADGALGLI